MPNRVSASPFLNAIMKHRPNPKCIISYSGDIPKPAEYVELVRRLQDNNPDVLFYNPTQLLCDPITKNLRRELWWLLFLTVTASIYRISETV